MKKITTLICAMVALAFCLPGQSWGNTLTDGPEQLDAANESSADSDQPTHESHINAPPKKKKKKKKKKGFFDKAKKAAKKGHKKAKKAVKKVRKKAKRAAKKVRKKAKKGKKKQSSTNRKKPNTAFDLFKLGEGLRTDDIKMNSYLMAEVTRAVYDNEKSNIIVSLNEKFKNTPGHGLRKHGCKEIKFFRIDTRVCILTNNKLIIVVFEGTEGAPPNRDAIADWVTDFYTVPVPLSAPPVFVHKGTYDALHLVLNWLKREVSTLKAKTLGHLYITGHSLGGGLAVLAAYKLMKARFKVSGVYTYGQPRVGERKFKAAYNKKLRSVTHRWVNVSDIVPLFPGVTAGQLRRLSNKIPKNLKVQPEGFWSHVGRTHNILSVGNGVNGKGVRLDDKINTPNPTKKALQRIISHHSQCCYAKKIRKNLSPSQRKDVETFGTFHRDSGGGCYFCP